MLNGNFIGLRFGGGADTLFSHLPKEVLMI